MPVATAGGGAEVGGGDTASRTTHSDSEELMVGLSSDLGDSGEEVVLTASTSREGTAKTESTSQEGTAKVGTAPSPARLKPPPVALLALPLDVNAKLRRGPLRRSRSVKRPRSLLAPLLSRLRRTTCSGSS